MFSLAAPTRLSWYEELAVTWASPILPSSIPRGWEQLLEVEEVEEKTIPDKINFVANFMLCINLPLENHKNPSLFDINL